MAKGNRFPFLREGIYTYGKAENQNDPSGIGLELEVKEWTHEFQYVFYEWINECVQTRDYFQLSQEWDNKLPLSQLLFNILTVGFLVVKETNLG